MTKLSGPPEMRRGKRDGKQNSNGKPNNWAMNLSPSNRRLHNESTQAERVPWKARVLTSAPSLRVDPMPPYSDPEPEILQERFPQQSQRRAAVKNSVYGLRMKVSAGRVEFAASSKAPAATSVCPKHKMFYPRLSSSGICFASSNEHSDVAWEATNAVYKDFAGAKPAWC